ncbi:hypothetical protein L1857_33470 [Amycolatopsis thermalba]|uniref:Serine/threonine protein kinase n=1 Tax=Amycolatopsis thermalba TaxID=944492 RepID=A0ABY4P597_9PSEU|nr:MULTISPECIES: hypothetical protein [Amycolatopsis]UQS27358.1 hypothetical protein L1857_33470 [Amycolatopsis thermalba]
MNDEVSVAELLEREGWTEQPRAPRSRFQVVAVMLAVVLGCGLAAILVKVGADTQPTDDAALFSLPSGPTGGLAGGGVPENPHTTERTNSSSRVVVTNQATDADAPGNGIPWSTKPRTSTSTETVTVTDSNQPPASSTDPGSPPGQTGPSQTGTAPGGDTTTTTTPSRTPPSCILIILCRP